MRLLRDALGASQERLADMIGSDVTANTISRWECGRLMPYPENREKLARIAAKNGMEHITGIFRDPEKDWLAIVAINDPQTYKRIVMLEILAANAHIFDSPEHGRHHNRFTEIVCGAEDLLGHLAEIVAVKGEEMLIPPSAHHQRFWLNFLERRKR